MKIVHQVLKDSVTDLVERAICTYLGGGSTDSIDLSAQDTMDLSGEDPRADNHDLVHDESLRRYWADGFTDLVERAMDQTLHVGSDATLV